VHCVLHVRAAKNPQTQELSQSLLNYVYKDFYVKLIIKVKTSCTLSLLIVFIEKNRMVLEKNMIKLTNNLRGRVGTNDHLYMSVLVVLTLNCFESIYIFTNAFFNRDCINWYFYYY